MSGPKNQIVGAEKIGKIIERMATQIVENNFHTEHLKLIGIQGQGVHLAQLLAREVEKVHPSCTTEVIALEISKEDPAHSEIRLSVELDSLKNHALVMVDDVMNTGRTQAYSLSYLLQIPVKKVETAVLVYRSHTAFPISVTYSGVALSTTIEDHIEVRLKEEVGAYLY
jgi:pyrimidine operon attenuation protein/uracil phosphoribosyltransferase